MASTSSLLPQTLAVRCVGNSPSAPQRAHIPRSGPSGIPGRRQLVLLLTATTALKAAELPSIAEDIGLFGLRKKLKKAEEGAEEIVKEGFEAADKGIEAAEKGIVAAEKGIEAAEKEIESAVSFGGFAQAGVVAGAELLGVLIATSIVNGILGPEAKKS
ncbi:hypothetical protein M9H77_15712 [Catharanthus roseus]|uniref:Uncharacterized protein n=1 Tax=Catharanthus roseus TaxID=4058 RepID=A0ACC0AY99_CATRO|nr:hypothetical protein M9H77_15712 [Catharanthus roseus]